MRQLDGFYHGYPEERACACGRLWLVTFCVPTNRSENLICRCGTIFARSSKGSLTAILLSPRERFPALRRIRYIVGVGMLQAAHVLNLKLASDSWLRPHRIMAYRHTNTPVRTYVRIETARDGKRSRP